MQNMNYIESEEFLVHVFLGLINSKKYEIRFSDLLMLEGYYLERVDNGLTNVLNVSREEISKFIESLEGYITIKESKAPKKIDPLKVRTKISIINPEDLKEVLLETIYSEEDEQKDYNKAIKKYIKDENERQIA